MNIKKKSIGKIIVICSILGFAAERFSRAPSTLLAKVICGDRYMQPVSGVIGDPSCGFNADMYLTAFLALTLVIGLVLLLSKSE